MKHDRDFFTPENVDEQVDQLVPGSTVIRLPRTRQTREPAQAEKNLVQDLQGYYQTEQQQDLASLERAWRQVATHLADQQERSRPTDTSSFAESLRSPRERTHRMLNSVSEHPKRGKAYRSLSALAAVLVAALLVGGLIAVQSLSRRAGTTGTAKATPTSLPIGTVVYTSPDINMGAEGLAWSPDSQRVAVATLDGVQIWDATTGKHKVNVQVPPDPANGEVYVYSINWSPNSQLVAIAARDNLLVANGLTGAIVHRYSVNATVASVTTTTGGPYLSALMPASGIHGFISVAWSPDGRFLAVSLANESTHVEILNAQTGVLAYTLPVPGNGIQGNLAWSSDGQYLAAFPGGTFGPSLNPTPTVIVWKISTRQIVFQRSAGPTDIAWQPGTHNLAFLASTSNQFLELETWNVERNQQVKRYQSNCFFPLIWSPDGKDLACSDNAGHIILIDASSGKQIYVYQGKYQGKTNTIEVMAWSPNGKYIASSEHGWVTLNSKGQMQTTPGVVRVWVA